MNIRLSYFVQHYAQQFENVKFVRQNRTMHAYNKKNVTIFKCLVIFGSEFNNLQFRRQLYSNFQKRQGDVRTVQW